MHDPCQAKAAGHRREPCLLLARTVYAVRTIRAVQRNDPRGCENHPLGGVTTARRFTTLSARLARRRGVTLRSAPEQAPARGAILLRGDWMLLSWPVLWALASALVVLALTH